MEVPSAQATRILAHARTWVCQRAGFEPTEACLLRPLAGPMDLLRRILEIVDRPLELQGEVGDGVAEQQVRLEVLRALPDVVGAHYAAGS